MPLIELDYWMSEITDIVGYYRNQRQMKTYFKQEERRVGRDLLRKAGVARVPA